jgi:hypothetical protein
VDCHRIDLIGKIMHRIDTSSAVSAMPTPSAAGTPGYFSRATDSGAPVATQMSPDFLNAVQEEIAGPIEAAGIPLSKTDNGQLLAAIRSFLGHGQRLSIGIPDRKPIPGETLIFAVMAAGEVLPSGATGSVFLATVAATANWTATLYKNDMAIGTVTVAAGARIGVFSVVADVVFADGDILKLSAPAAQDSTLSGLAVAIFYRAA